MAAAAPAQSSLQASVADEAEELQAEAGVSSLATGAPTDAGAIPDGDVKQEHGDEVNGEEEAEEDPDKIPDDACETLYLQNLNEKVRTEVMKETLALLFKPYRPLLPVVAHGNVRMRGQAFVTFNDVDTANRARREVGEFPLYADKKQIRFAKTRSDSAVKKLAGDEALDEHKKARLERKRKTRRDNPIRRKAAAKLRAGLDATTNGGAPTAKRQKIQMPDEYLPPNNVLFIQNLPEGTTADDLRDVFSVHPGLLEIRTIPAKKDIAFVEYADEASAGLAKDALHNFKIDGETKMKVTYARK